MADYQIEALLFCTPRLWNYSHCDIIIISSSSSPRCYKIYWFITLKDLFVSLKISSFLKNYGMSFFGWKGPSIKYVTLFLANFDPPPLVTLCHTSRDPPKSTSHISDHPPDF